MSGLRTGVFTILEALRAAYGSTRLGLLGDPKRNPWSEVSGFGSTTFAVVLVMAVVAVFDVSGTFTMLVLLLHCRGKLVNLFQRVG